MLTFLDQQSFIFIETADFLHYLAKVKLVNARLPSFSILTAVDVITLGTYPRLPSIINKYIMPPEKITEDQRKEVLDTLNRIIQCRLALSEMPSQLKNFKIQNGCVKFHVKSEFMIIMTLWSDDFKMPWRLLKLKFLVRDSQNPNKPLIHPYQTNDIHRILQYRLNENQSPLIDLYKSLHFFSQSLQLEVLFQQINHLNRVTFGRYYKIVEYSNWKRLTVKYWLEYSTKNQYDFKFSISVGENSDFLQTNHSPQLNWRDHKNIDTILRTDELLIEKLVHQIIKFRSKKRLLEIQSAFEKITYCKTCLNETKPALEINFFVTKNYNESLWIMIDFYSGLYQVFLPSGLQSSSLIKNSIESCINSDMKKLESCLINLRVKLILKRCELLAASYGFSCFDELSILSFQNDDIFQFYSKLEKNRLFIELKKQDKIFIMLTVRTIDDLQNDQINWYENSEYIENKNALRFNYYIINTKKCKYDGELDPTKPFLKLTSITQFKKSLSIQLNNSRKLNSIIDDKTDELKQNEDMLTSFIDMIFYIEDVLPFNNLMSLLNKQNIVIQNVQTNPSVLELLSVNLISEPFICTQSDLVDYNQIDKLSEELWSYLLSFTIRHKQFKDYLNPSLTLISFTKQTSLNLMSKYIFTIEFTFQKGILDNEYNNLGMVDVYSTELIANNLEQLYSMIKLEWISMCKMFFLIKQCIQFNLASVASSSKLNIKKMNFKKLVLKYGPNNAYTIQFQWSKEQKMFDIILGVDNSNIKLGPRSHLESPYINYQQIYLNDIKKYFNTNQSVVDLVYILNYTCVSMYGLSKLVNVPKFYTKASIQPQQPIFTYPSFSLLFYSLDHFKLIYMSKYSIDIKIKPNGLVKLQDGSYSLTDATSQLDDFVTIPMLNQFLNMFLDENVEELLKKRLSLAVYEDSDNNNNQSMLSNDSMSSSQQQKMDQQQSNSQSQHVFLPPTSPAIVQQPRSTQPIPTPSPVHNYFVQSPSMNAPSVGAPTSNNPASIAQSPGFANFGSPAIPHSSPTTNPQQPQSVAQQQLSNQQLTSSSVQSPSSHGGAGGFMSSPAPNSTQPQQPNYSIQSPANFSEFPLSSPVNSSVPIRSPYVSGGPPSASTNIPSVQEDSTKVPIANRQNQSSHLKKTLFDSFKVYLSENGFLKLLTPTTETDLNSFSHLMSPLETFLATSHLKRIIFKSIQNDQNTFMVKNQEQLVFKAGLIEFQFLNEISPHFHSFQIVLPIAQQQQLPPDISVDSIQKYLNSRILVAPFKSSNLMSFLNLLSVEYKLLKDLVKLFEYEMNPSYFKFPWRIKFSWTIPYGYQLKNIQKTNLALFFQTQTNQGFQRKDKLHYMLIYLISQHKIYNPTLPNSLLLLISYDSMTNSIQHELLRPLSGDSQVLISYEANINSIFLNKQKGTI